jgi:hypothetical protein
MNQLVKPAEVMSAESLFEAMIRQEQFEQEYKQSGRTFDRRILSRKYYHEITPAILALPASVWADVYPFDWDFNANEKLLWGSIRRRPMAIYPEFPVLNYFVDFGNPLFQIALEADSKQFHDKKSDAERDKRLLKNGWLVFRVPYEENVSDFVELGDIGEMFDIGDEERASEELHKWLLHTGDGVVEGLYFRYFMSDEERSRRDNKYPGFSDLVDRTLKSHRLVL